MLSMRALNIVDSAVLEVAGTAVGLSSGTPALAGGKISGKTVRRMFITVVNADIGWRADGTAPTAGTCHPLLQNDSFSFTGANYKQLIGSIQFIRIAGTATAACFITYFD